MRRRAVIAAVVALVVVVGGVAAWLMSGDEPVVDVAGSTTVPTTEAPAAEEPALGPIAPLTGELVGEAEAPLLARPALAVKIDNDPAAAPHWGLEAADLVVEVKVEGISRFVAVFHSRDVGDVGPVRSARTGDPDLLAMLGRPLTAWSGANPTTTRMMLDTPWVQSVDVDRLTSAYRRSGDRRAPHNLLLDARAAFAAAEEPVQPPTPIFGYAEPETAPRGVPVAGVRLAVGKSASSYVWDAERGGWRRFVDGRPHVDLGGEQLGPTNVVVLETGYGPSRADARSPEARSTGGGRAWILSAGHLIEGSWIRPERTDPWILLDGEGEPVELRPGATWVALPEAGDGPGVLGADEAAALVGAG